ncbi:SUKH-3 domain-containing protein [Streptomyces erythrochromogenes]|uniref:SUKH-3 domain-containing protein n=1 Tax=Streptomyces erythrochromogenes TaxID=285574 RepID=UPI003437E914
MTSSPRFSSQVEEELLAAGWTPGRSVDVERWTAPFEAAGLTAHPAARDFLAEFGGLHFVFSGPGVECARQTFELDPLLCEGEEDSFLEWSEEQGHSYFPVGHLDEGRFALLGIDETGALHGVESVLDRYGPVPECFERLLLGLQPERIASV